MAGVPGIAAQLFSALARARVNVRAIAQGSSERNISVAISAAEATKARLLLMACLMKLGSLPPAADPDHPTDAEREATRTKLAQYQEIFDTH